MSDHRLRRAWIKTYIEQTSTYPDIHILEEKFPDTHQRSLYRDLEHITEELIDPSQLEQIKALVFGTSKKRIKQFNDANLTRLLIAFITKQMKIESTVDSTHRFVWEAWKPEVKK